MGQRTLSIRFVGDSRGMSRAVKDIVAEQRKRRDEEGDR